MKRVYTKVGDIFAVRLDDGTNKYLQFVASDITQLNSNVIRVFKQAYPCDQPPDFDALVKGEVELYAHCVTKWGVKFGYWEKVGKSSSVGAVNTVFRDSSDYGTGFTGISRKWWVWKIDEEQRFVGTLEGDNLNSEIGIVISPKGIVHRMKSGEYDFSYVRHE